MTDKPQPDKFDWATELSDAQEAQTPAHIKAMERAWLWMENQADSQSKGGHATFDLMMLREERDALRAALDAAPTIQPVPRLPESDASIPAEQQGLFRKFDVRRVDGSDQPGGKHHGCTYFVLDVDHDHCARPALAAYAAACEATRPALAADLLTKWGAAPTTQPAPQQEAQEPAFWTVCAQYEGGDETGWIPLPGYSNETEHGVKNLVLQAARKEGYKGTVTGRLMELNWEIRPVYLAPWAAPQPSPAAQGDALDAERYAIVRRGQHWSVIDGLGDPLTGDRLDAAVDAARAAQEGKP